MKMNHKCAVFDLAKKSQLMGSTQSHPGRHSMAYNGIQELTQVWTDTQVSSLNSLSQRIQKCFKSRTPESWSQAPPQGPAICNLCLSLPKHYTHIKIHLLWAFWIYWSLEICKEVFYLYTINKHYSGGKACNWKISLTTIPKDETRATITASSNILFCWICSNLEGECIPKSPISLPITPQFRWWFPRQLLTEPPYSPCNLDIRSRWYASCFKHQITY